MYDAVSLLAAVTVIAASLLVLLVTSQRYGGRLAARPAPVVRRTLALRDRAGRTTYLAVRDPDAPGRRRARAPGRCSLAAPADDR